MKPCTILLMGDDAAVAEALARAVADSGISVLAATTLGQALRILGEHGPEIDLVLTELEPRMQGMLLLSMIRRACKDLPVVVLTAHGERDVRAAILEQGAAEFLNKPISAVELRATLKRFCPCLCSCPQAEPLAAAA